MAIADDEIVKEKPPSSPKEFVKVYGPIAEMAGRELGVDPNVLLGKWGMETGWGKAIIGDFNLGNIKDPTGKGTKAFDKREKSNDSYLSFEDPEGFGQYYVDFIKRGYPDAVGAGSDVQKFTSGLASGVYGSYFGKTDPERYQEAVQGASNLASKSFEPTAAVAVPELPPPADVDETTTEADQGKRTEVLSPEIGAAIGATAGVGLGGSAAVLQGKIDAAKEAYDIFTSRNASSAPGSATPRTGETPGGKWGAKTGYGMGEGTVQESSSRYQRAVPKGKVSGAQAKTWGPAMPGESPDIVQRMIDRAKAAEAAKLAQQAEMAAASKTSPLLSYAKRLAAMPVKGGLAGAGLGFGAVDAMNRYNQGDKAGAAVGGLGTAAGLAAGFVPSMGALPAAGMAAPLYLTASDRIERLKKHPEMIQLQEDEYDAMGNRQR